MVEGRGERLNVPGFRTSLFPRGSLVKVTPSMTTSPAAFLTTVGAPLAAAPDEEEVTTFAAGSTGLPSFSTSVLFLNPPLPATGGTPGPGRATKGTGLTTTVGSPPGTFGATQEAFRWVVGGAEG